jgi:hypothetical protein
MSQSELVEGATPTTALVDALFRQGLRTTATPPAEQCVAAEYPAGEGRWESLQRKGGLRQRGHPVNALRDGGQYLLGMRARSGV